MPLPTGTRFPIQVTSPIKPANNGDFPVISDVDVEGGYQVRVDLTDRDSIPVDNRKEGMLVFVQSDGYFYTLSGGIDNTNWIVKDFSGSGGTLVGDTNGPATANTVVGINGLPIDTGTPGTQGAMLHYVPPYLKYCPASCTNATRPSSPFVGQMVFVTDLDTPNPIALWWNGVQWVDNHGITR